MQTDLSTVTDVKELKALAFDQQILLEQAQNNIRVILARLQQVQQQPPKPDKAEAEEASV